MGERKPGQSKPQVHFIANAVYSEKVGGGDIHFYHMAEAVLRAGYPLHFFGGHALAEHLKARGIEAQLTLTDERSLPPVNLDTLSGQAKLFRDYAGRYRRTLRALDEIQPEDIVYGVTDYWFDAWPMIRSRARRKMMVLGMDAPSMRHIVTRGRPDVTATRLTSMYYWASQNLSLRRFQKMPNKRFFYVHPLMKPRLLKMGYSEEELVFISNGFDLEMADRTPEQPKEYDVVWVGRVHRQKGIDDLLATLLHLKARVPDFKALLVGRLEHELRPRIEETGLADRVRFSGFVSEQEKFRLFKCSRVFLMPSTYESWGIVVAEALACGVPVVAYELEAYRPIFGELIRYVPPFDLEQFKAESLNAVEEARRSKIILSPDQLAAFKAEHSWQAAQAKFIRTLDGLAQRAVS